MIIMASGGFSDSQDVEQWLSQYSSDIQNNGNLSLVGGIALSIPADLVAKLQAVQGLTVVPDAPVQLSGTVTRSTSSQLWPYVSGNSDLWLGDQYLYSSRLPAIAVIDSGIQSRSDFGNRIVASVNLSTISGNSDMNDDAGHGTFVAGIAAGNAPGLAGAAPGAPLVSIKVMDAAGEAKTSDVIQACQWILDHKAQYNIRVANFSLHSSYSTNFYRDPLDQAVEKLWFNGVTVVAAAGNYGVSNTQPSGVLYSPGNDPFVITVGALDLNGTARSTDDVAAPWSAWGYTPDGFAKPEISAPGRYMVGPIPAGSTLTQEKAANMVGSNEIQLSGTSFAAPVVSGTVAELLARHPSWTPDQVKGALMKSARRISNVGEPAVRRSRRADGDPRPRSTRTCRTRTSGSTSSSRTASRRHRPRLQRDELGQRRPVGYVLELDVLGRSVLERHVLDRSVLERHVLDGSVLERYVVDGYVLD